MQQMTINMPAVSACSASECVYNAEGGCHAKAITVGDGVHPGCDTFLHARKHAREQQRTSGVGACKVSGCTHNQDYECMADGIDVGMQGGSVQCLTFSTRTEPGGDRTRPPPAA
jgi:hypothetical protein